MGFKEFLIDPQQQTNILKILVAYWLLNLLVYLPFIFSWGKFGILDFQHENTSVFMRYWDGPYYAAVAKTFYDSDHTFFQLFSFFQPSYYTNHFPLFPILIRLVGGLIPIEIALLLVNQIFAVAGVILLYYFFVQIMPYRRALTLSLVQLIFPLKSLVLRNVGNSEILFFFWVVLIMLLLVKRRFYWAIFVASLAMATRIAAAFLWPGFIVLWFFEYRSDWKKLLFSGLIPLVFLGILAWQGFALGVPDFGQLLSGYKTVYAEPPLAVVFSRRDLADHYFFLYGLVVCGAIFLSSQIKQDRRYFPLLVISLSGALVVFLSAHADNWRFVWPFFPFLVLLPFQKVFADRRVQVGLLLLLPLVVLATWSDLISNAMSFSWLPVWVKALKV